MRNLVYLTSLIILISCKESIYDLNNDLNNDIIYIEVENGDKTKDTIEFDILEKNTLWDSLKISRTKLIYMCGNASRYFANYNVSFKSTYKYEKHQMIGFDRDSNEICLTIGGSCENAYGVRDNIYNNIYFDSKAKIKRDKKGYPKIDTF